MPNKTTLSVGNAAGLTGLTYRLIWSTFNRTIVEIYLKLRNLSKNKAKNFTVF